MLRITNERDQPMLGGVFTPLEVELDEVGLRVDGRLPEGLAGTFWRNGPNPMFEPRGRYHMFDGDGMLHRIRIDEGGATYKNRFILSDQLKAEMAAGKSIYGGIGELYIPTPDEVGNAGGLKNPANTNLVRHAGRLLALYEAAPPIEVDYEMSTIGVHDFLGTHDASPFTAHPHTDPKTGEMHAFAYLPFAPFLRYFRVDRRGAMVRRVDIALEACHVMHDFMITDTHAVFVRSPLLFDLRAALKGGEYFHWNPAFSSAIGVLSLVDGDDEVTWYDCDDGYVNHYFNGWRVGDTINVFGSVMRNMTYTAGEGGAMDNEGADAEAGHPTRFSLNLLTGETSMARLDDARGDFTRVADAAIGRPNRFGHMCAFSGRPTAVGQFDSVVRYEFATDATGTPEVIDKHAWVAPEGSFVGEFVFAANTGSNATGDENDGWLLGIVTDPALERSALMVLDAQRIADGPVASIEMPHQLPFGFHANFFSHV